MSAQKLDRVVLCYRIGDPNGEFPIFSPEGSRVAPGRWNTVDTPAIYTSAHYSTAMLEKLVHGNGRLPPNQHYVKITIPNGISYEAVTNDTLPGWYEADQRVSRAFGEQWIKQGRSALLLVPSVVARLERNIIINPAHREFGRITTDLHMPVWWDKRLFQP